MRFRLLLIRLLERSTRWRPYFVDLIIFSLLTLERQRPRLFRTVSALLFVLLIKLLFFNHDGFGAYPIEELTPCDTLIYTPTDMEESGKVEWEIYLPHLSAFIFPNSTFYPPNTAIVLFNAMFNYSFLVKSLPFRVDLVNGSTTNLKFTIEPASWRKRTNKKLEKNWQAFRAVGRLPPNAVLTHTYLRAEGFKLDEAAVRVPFVKPPTEERDFVTCWPAMYEFDKWQTMLTSLETWLFYGAYVHMHFSSSITPIYKLLKEYERSGEIAITRWPRMEFQRGIVQPGKKQGFKNWWNVTYKPWLDVEEHNENIILNRCLMLYKTTARHLAFFDVDDIFVPPSESMSLPSYFESLFEKHGMTSAFVYPLVFDQVDAENDPQAFSIRDLLGSQRHLKPQCEGRFVADPRRVDTMSIHQPIKNIGGFHHEMVDMSEHYAVSLRYMNAINSSAYHLGDDEAIEIDAAPVRQYPRATTQRQIAEAFAKRLKSNPTLAALFAALPLRKCDRGGYCGEPLFTNKTATCISTVAVADYRTFWLSYSHFGKKPRSMGPDYMYIQRLVHFPKKVRVIEKRCNFTEV